MGTNKKVRIGKDLAKFLTDFGNNFEKSIGLMTNKKVRTNNAFVGTLIAKRLQGKKEFKFKIKRTRREIRLVFNDKDF